MARVRNLTQRYGTSQNSPLFDVLYNVQNALGYATRQGRFSGGVIQAAATITINNPVVRVVGTATVTTINAADFGTPIYIYAQDGLTFSASGGNVANTITLSAGETAMAQYDSVKQQWFVLCGANGLTSLANVGGGAEVYKNTTIPVAYLRTLVAGTNIGITQGTNTLTIANTSTATIGGSIAAEQIAFGSGTNTIEGENDFKYFKSLNTQKVDEIWFKRPLVNVLHFGAKGDGSTDDTDTIQAAIDYATTVAGTVLFPGKLASGGSACYIIGKTAGTGLMHKANVCYLGEGKYQSLLKWRPYSGGAVVDVGGNILDTTNVEMNGVVIQGLGFSKHGSVATGLVYGIRGGSDLSHYNSALAVFRDLRFTSLQCGIDGSGAGYVETGASRTIGFFDCTFENIEYFSNVNGVRTGGSGNVHIRPFFWQNTAAALVMDYISVESFSGENFYGGTFTGNNVDVRFDNGGSFASPQYRTTNFFGTWFESSNGGILDWWYGPAAWPIPLLAFQGCVLQSNGIQALGIDLIDARKVTGLVTVNECVIYKTDAAHSDRILGGTNTFLEIRDCIKFGPTGWGSQAYIGTDASLNATKLGTQALPGAGATTVVTWDNTGAAAGSFDREGCYDSGVTNTTYTVPYKGTYSVQARVLIEYGAVAGAANLRITHNGTAVGITYHYFAALSLHHMVCTANISAAVGDTIVVSVYSAQPATILDQPIIGFPNAHYNTWQVTREF